MTKWVLDHDSLRYAARKAGYMHMWGEREVVNCEALSHDSCLNQQTVYGVFNSVKLPQANTLITLADALGVDVMDLVKQAGE